MVLGERDRFSTIVEHHPWGVTVKYESQEDYSNWWRAVLRHPSGPIVAYCFPFWTDHGAAKVESVAKIIRILYKDMRVSQRDLAVVANSMAGVGRTKTFLIGLKFYEVIQESNSAPKLFTLEATARVVLEFREKRGDNQFVQMPQQFYLLYQLVQIFYKEKFS